MRVAEALQRHELAQVLLPAISLQGSIAVKRCCAHQCSQRSSKHTRAPPPCRLVEEGLSDQRHITTFAYQFTAGEGSLDLEGVVAAIRQAKEARDATEARRARILELLTAEGLQEYQHHLPRVQAYISSGQGSEGAVLEAARQKRAEGQRRVAVAARLAAEGIPEHFMRTLPSMYAYISRSEGSEDAAVASAVARHQLEQAEVQRRTAMRALLAAEELPESYATSYYGVPAVLDYIQCGEGSEEGAMEAARAQHQLEQAEVERRAAVRALLMAEQLPGDYLYTVPSVREYIQSGAGSQAAAMEAARAQAHLEQARAQRRSAVTALLVAEQLPEGYMQLVLSVREYIYSGKGSEGAAMEAARAHHQEQLPRLQRDARVVELLTANLLSLSYRYYLPAIAKFISTGEGTEEGVLAAARAQQLQEMAYPASDGDYSDEFL
jgi:hypothetical protein